MSSPPASNGNGRTRAIEARRVRFAEASQDPLILHGANGPRRLQAPARRTGMWRRLVHSKPGYRLSGPANACNRFSRAEDVPGRPSGHTGAHDSRERPPCAVVNHLRNMALTCRNVDIRRSPRTVFSGSGGGSVGSNPTGGAVSFGQTHRALFDGGTVGWRRERRFESYRGRSFLQRAPRSVRRRDRRFESYRGRSVMPQDMPDSRTHDLWVRLSVHFGVLGAGPGGRPVGW